MFLCCASLSKPVYVCFFGSIQATFGEGRLGFTLFREEMGPRKGKGVVCKVHQGGTAQTLGVQLGDAVSGVNKRR